MNQHLQERIARRRKASIIECSVLCGVVALLGIGGYFSIVDGVRKKRQESVQTKLDQKTSATLIEKKESVTANGYAGLMFFDMDGDTNTAEAVVHFVTQYPEKMEEIRRLKIGDIRLVSNWKNVFFDDRCRQLKIRNWVELKREQ
ncbi:MAG: hypothetical protein IJV07_02375 [Alphaproteobacteria bacterium]|nr:hypothetical protein [Alphaproteobacteria bacterium]